MTNNPYNAIYDIKTSYNSIYERYVGLRVEINKANKDSTCQQIPLTKNQKRYVKQISSYFRYVVVTSDLYDDQGRTLMREGEHYFNPFKTQYNPITPRESTDDFEIYIRSDLHGRFPTHCTPGEYQTILNELETIRQKQFGA